MSTRQKQSNWERVHEAHEAWMKYKIPTAPELISLLNEAISAEERPSYFLGLRAEVRIALGDNESLRLAKSDLEKALGIEKEGSFTNYLPLKRLGQVCSLLGERDAAFDAYSKAAEMSHDHSCYGEMGDLAMSGPNPDRLAAIKWYNTAIRYAAESHPGIRYNEFMNDYEIGDINAQLEVAKSIENYSKRVAQAATVLRRFG